jgi:DNA-binding MarR family transcriptional regulator
MEGNKTDTKSKFIYIPKRLAEYSRELKPNVYKIYLTLVNECIKNNSNKTFIEDVEILDITGLSIPTITRALSNLEKHDFIKRKRIGRQRKITLLDY